MRPNFKVKDNFVSFKGSVFKIQDSELIAQFTRTCCDIGIDVYISNFCLYDIKELLVWLDAYQNNIPYELPSNLYFTGYAITDILNLNTLVTTVRLSDKFLRILVSEIDNKQCWNNISKYQNLSINFLRDFEDKINWYLFSNNNDLSEDIIREFQDRVDWDCISMKSTLSESFIREFKNKVTWQLISRYQILSEGFIREYKDYVCWIGISSDQRLSEIFMVEFKDSLSWNHIFFSKNLSDKFKEEMSEYFKRCNI